MSTMGCAYAQIAPDNTLPINSNVQKIGNTIKIEGGTTVGSNLFHSFSEFSLPTGSTADFNNSLNIQNIISRVTGKSLSNIDGLIRANGTANLFLMNPNGIIFGQNARLDIGGSFVATTSNAIGFGNQGFFSATNPNTPQLLTINPTALLFNQIRAASIENNSVAFSGLNQSTRFKRAMGLRVPDGKSLLLVGGDIKMDGGGLYAFGGRVELGGLSSEGTVGLNGDGNNLSLSFPDSVERSDIFLSKGTEVNVYAPNGGSIVVNARNLEMTGESSLGAGTDRGLSSDNSKAGNVSVNAKGAIKLNNRSAIANLVLVGANRQAGDVNISASTLQVLGGAGVFTTTLGAGKGGSVRVDAQDVQLIGRSADNERGSSLNASAESTGDAGDLIIKTNTLLVRDGATVSVSTGGAGKGGSVRIDAQDVQLIGTSTDNKRASGVFASTKLNSRGDGGDLIIKTNTLLVRDGATINVSTRSAGKGGSLRVDAQDVQLIGRSTDNQSLSGLFAFTQSTGNAGDLIIKTNTLLVRDGAAVNVQSRGTGTAGNMTLNARSIRLNNNALFSATTSSAKVNPNKEQAIININSKDLIMTGNSNITTNATGENVIGGNINIDTDILVAFVNSDISANSTDFRGGNVKINATGIFGTQFRDAPTPNSDITATGKNQQLNGSVQINTPDVDPSSGLVQLPADFVDRSGLIAQDCPANKGNSFTITGRGGLPPLPTQALGTNQTATVDWVTLNPQEQRNTNVEKSPHLGRNLWHKNRHLEVQQISTPIVEATGWVINNSGAVELTAAAPIATQTNAFNSAIAACPSQAAAIQK
ncbi:two-partner secretion domain-containing protein [Nostoc sp.]|uniref:two-partner secretion domain-containing protein n=1 Tax=Nostoc sp. TaxID=1180 RepID=UPI002FF715A5